MSQPYNIPLLSCAEAFDSLPFLPLSHFQWTCRYRPKTEAKLAFLPEVGFFVRMRCWETAPKCQCSQPNGPVCTDSAMEVFLFFPQADPHRYFNFEVNAAGVMHAASGPDRNDRVYLTSAEFVQTHVAAARFADHWQVDLQIPLSLIAAHCGTADFAPGTPVHFNFYKIAEDPSLEHYVSFHKIPLAQPDFHQPVHFAPGVLADAPC